MAVNALIYAGMNPVEARRVVAVSEPYFTKTLRLTDQSPLRVPRRPNFTP